MKAAEVHGKLDEDLDRLSKLVSAASCFKKIDPESRHLSPNLSILV
jgi:hypothetical protein